MSEYDVQFTNETPKKKNEQTQLPEKKIRTVTKNPAKTKKKSCARKLTDAFIAEDVATIKNYIVKDVLIPAVKKGIVDIITNGVDMLFYGETGHTSRSRGGRMSYNSIYDGRRSPRRDAEVIESRRTPYDRRIVDTLQEAKDAVDQVNELIDVYGQASIADFYEMIQVTGEYTDHDYGWNHFIEAKYVRVPDGWMIQMPKASPIKKN